MRIVCDRAPAGQTSFGPGGGLPHRLWRLRIFRRQSPLIVIKRERVQLVAGYQVDRADAAGYKECSVTPN
jgi:hypothetical protein